eukprot:107852_1
MSDKCLFICCVSFTLIALVLYLVIYIEMYEGADIVHGKVLHMINEDMDRKSDLTIQYHLNLSKQNMHIADTHFKILIGIGAVKCGTTYFQKLFRESIYYLPIHHTQQFAYHIHGETHYFTNCHRCTFKDYYELLMQGTPANNTHNKQMILSEKTPIYLHNQLASNLLTFYSNLYHKNIYFYIILRNPVNRFWSNMWMITKNNCIDNVPNHDNIFTKLCLSLIDSKYGLNKQNTKHIAIMQKEAMQLIANSRNTQPLMYELVQILSKVSKVSRVNPLDDTKQWQIIDIVHQIQHDKMHYYSDFVMLQSCYFPLLLMWFKKYEKYKMKLNGINDFDDRFRIIQSEIIFENPYKTLQELVCWVVGSEMVSECEREYGIHWDMDARHKIDIEMRFEFKQQQAPSDVDVMDTHISNFSVVLKEFYNPCNDRLYEFLAMHKKIILGSMQLERWW